MAYGFHIERESDIELAEWQSAVQSSTDARLEESENSATNPTTKRFWFLVWLVLRQFTSMDSGSKSFAGARAKSPLTLRRPLQVKIRSWLLRWRSRQFCPL